MHREARTRHSETCTEYLTDWRRAQKAAFAEINDAAMGKWKESGKRAKTFKPLEVGPDTPVVSNDLDGFTDPNVFSRWFRGFWVEKGFGTYGEQDAIIDAAGRKRIRKAKYEGLNFHELRHTQATLLIGSGADIKTVQTLLKAFERAAHHEHLRARHRGERPRRGRRHRRDPIGKVTHGCFKSEYCQKFNKSVKLSA